MELSTGLEGEPGKPNGLILKQPSTIKCQPEINQIRFCRVESEHDKLVEGILSEPCRKDAILDFFRDRILTPRSIEGIDFKNCIIGASWSPPPPPAVSTNSATDTNGGKCKLGVLTNHFQLIVYGQGQGGQSLKEISGELHWSRFIDLTLIFNQLLLDKWDSIYRRKKDPHYVNPTIDFAEYKKRLYQLAIMNFCWISQVNYDQDQVDQEEKKCHLLITAHGNGDLLLWSIDQDLNYNRQLLSGYVNLKNVQEIGYPSVMKYNQLTNYLHNYGILTIGTKSGVVKCFLLHHVNENNKESWTLDDVGDKGEIWSEDDLIEVSFIEQRIVCETFKKILVEIVFCKSPNHLVISRLEISIDCGALLFSSPQTQIIKDTFGPIQGLVYISHGIYLILHWTGGFATLSIEGGENENKIQNYSLNTLSLSREQLDSPWEPKIPIQTINTCSRPIKDFEEECCFYTGLAISPNKSILCTGKGIDGYFDHLQIRHPSKLLFFTVLNEDTDFWDKLKVDFSSCKSNMRRISDSLQAIRTDLRLRRKTFDLMKKELEKNFKSMSVTDLRLLLWIISAYIHLPNDSGVDQNPEEAIKNRKLYDHVEEKRVEIQELLLERYFLALFEVLKPQAKWTLGQKQSIGAILKFLYERKIQCAKFPLENFENYKSTCPICSGELVQVMNLFEQLRADQIKIIKKEAGETPTIPYSKPFVEQIQNSLWKNRSCPAGHLFPICVQSLLPIPAGLPVRFCGLCQVPACNELVFDDQPDICPFCGSKMKVNEHFESKEMTGEEQDMETSYNEIPEEFLSLYPDHQF